MALRGLRGVDLVTRPSRAPRAILSHDVHKHLLQHGLPQEQTLAAQKNGQRIQRIKQKFHNMFMDTVFAPQLAMYQGMSKDTQLDAPSTRVRSEYERK